MRVDFLQRQWNRIPGSTPGSRWRRAFSYYAMFLILVMLADLIGAASGGFYLVGNIVSASVLAGLSVGYFLVVVVAVIFLTSQDFRPAPRRLAADTLVSIVFAVLAFSLVYRFSGITMEFPCNPPTRPQDFVYFSAVTFSTLGYGDFKPCESIRLAAAFQAIFGNLHLGLIVGSAFFFAQSVLPGSGNEHAAEHHDRPENKND